MRVSKLLRKMCGFGRDVVIEGWDLPDLEGHDPDGDRPVVVVRVRASLSLRDRCGRCGELAPGYDQGGGERAWRHIDVGYAMCTLVGSARRVHCAEHGPTVIAVPWARHDTVFTRVFEDLVVHDAIVGNKQAAADRYGISWRAVHNACARVAAEALAGVDLLAGLRAISVDEVKYKKGHKYLTVICDHVTGRVVWAAEGRSKKTVGKFFDALGARVVDLEFVTADGATWITDVVAVRAPNAIVCLDTFHVVVWANKALDEVRRAEWNRLRDAGLAQDAKAFKGLRFVLRRRWENLTFASKALLWELSKTNSRTLRAWQLKEELVEVFTLALLPARRALDAWLAWASRSKLPSFVKLARSIRNYRASIEATIEWKLTNGIAESNNASIGRIRTNARGFHKPENFIAMIYLDRAGIRPDLPWHTHKSVS